MRVPLIKSTAQAIKPSEAMEIKPSGQVILPSEATEMIKRWRWIVVILAFVLPLIAMICASVIVVFPGSSVARPYRAMILALDLRITPPEGSFFKLLAMAPVIAFTQGLLQNWPFFILAARIKHHVLKRWPDVKAARAAIIAGLTGLLIPYVFFYAIVMPVEFVTDAQGYFGGLVYGWLVLPLASLLAFIGLRIGPALRFKR